MSREFRTGAPWELLYADDLVVIAETEEELRTKLKKWKDGMEAKGLRVNVGKTKAMFGGHDLQSLKDSGKYPCSVCRNGVGENSGQKNIALFPAHRPGQIFFECHPAANKKSFFIHLCNK